ncbi:hypothetical protein CDAR_218741 [Caerostris darwini]|uniref:Uncharacterized protein n=1 Tax=Caerostris darwini TaxID=1538125 RepID=A0AAV4UG41_9ARAC|nr:hypothetical protein CDAR_218741 [Caerostris darwini]
MTHCTAKNQVTKSNRTAFDFTDSETRDTHPSKIMFVMFVTFESIKTNVLCLYYPNTRTTFRTQTSSKLLVLVLSGTKWCQRRNPHEEDTFFHPSEG